MNISFKLKLFIAFFVYGVLISALSYLSLFSIDEVAPKYRAEQTLNIKENSVNLFIKDINKKFLSVKNSYALNKYITTKKDKKILNTLFSNITQSSSCIINIKYTNKNRIRKSTYLKDILNTSKDEIYYSNISFYKNSKKQIEPTLHVGAAIFIDNKIVGVLSMDVLIKKFLYELSSTNSGEIYIFDTNENTLIEPQNVNNWSSYLKNKDTLSKYKFSKDNSYFKKIPFVNDEILHIVIKAKSNTLGQEIHKHSKELQIFLISLILFSIPMAFLFAKIYSKQKKKDDKERYDQDVLLSLFDLSDVVLFKWNNDAKWSVDSVSKSVFKLLGYSQEEFETNKVNYVDCIHPDDIKEVSEEHVNSISYRAYYFEHKPYRLIRKDASIKWILHSTVIVRDDNNKIINFVGYLTDITELKNHEIELKQISRTDRLTQTHNRMYTDNILENQYYRFKRDSEICSVILVDIDHFKSVNDTYGHLAGDKVLIEFAKILSNSIRQGDVLGRWGGEEFLIILAHTKLSEALQLAEKLRKAIDIHEFTEPKHLTASFGVSTFAQESTIDILIDTADKALYESKKNGRNCVSTIQTEIEANL